MGHLLDKDKEDVELDIADVCRQSQGSNLCGYYVSAFAMDLIDRVNEDIDLSCVRYDENRMAAHYEKLAITKTVERFPRKTSSKRLVLSCLER